MSKLRSKRWHSLGWGGRDHSILASFPPTSRLLEDETLKLKNRNAIFRAKQFKGIFYASLFSWENILLSFITLSAFVFIFGNNNLIHVYISVLNPTLEKEILPVCPLDINTALQHMSCETQGTSDKRLPVNLQRKLLCKEPGTAKLTGAPDLTCRFQRPSS